MVSVAKISNSILEELVIENVCRPLWKNDTNTWGKEHLSYRVFAIDDVV